MIENKAQLISYLERCSKPKKDWRIGFEYEIFPYHTKTNKPLSYQGLPGTLDIFLELKKTGWIAHYESGYLTKLTKNNSSISLEPGGQLELSSAPHNNIHEVHNELTTYIAQLLAIGQTLDISYLTLGFHPEWKLQDIPKMPNPNNRYHIISEHLRKHGTHGIDMMFRTCSTQASLDYGSESDMIHKYRVSLSLQPILTALFSNSPFIDGSPSQFLSARSNCWANANPKRTGIFPLVFEKDFSFEKFVDHTLDLPLYLIYREGRFINANGESFRKFMEGSLSILPGEVANIDDWYNHICTLWPEVRLKNILEIRGSDSGPISSVCSLNAIVTGLLYEQSSLDSAWDLVKNWSAEMRNQLYIDVIHEGLNARINKTITAKDIAKEILDIAYSGLKSRKQNNKQNQDETYFMDYAYEIARSGKTAANLLLQKYNNEWKHKINIQDICNF